MHNLTNLTAKFYFNMLLVFSKQLGLNQIDANINYLN